MFVEALLPDVIPYYGGSTLDNGNNTIKEGRVTFDLVMQYCRDNGMEDETVLNGIIHRGMFHGDPFNIDNLVCQHASLCAIGNREKEEHSQVHHRQLMQSIHGVYSTDWVSRAEKVLGCSVLNDKLGVIGITSHSGNECKGIQVVYVGLHEVFEGKEVMGIDTAAAITTI